MVNIETFKVHPFPPLYKSGVRFQNEPEGVEEFCDAWIVRQRGHGDCAHLCAWRIAELRLQGIRATIRISWMPRRDGKKLFHVLVRLPSPTAFRHGKHCRICWAPRQEWNPNDLTVEDPSHLLGMNS